MSAAVSSTLPLSDSPSLRSLWAPRGCASSSHEPLHAHASLVRVARKREQRLAGLDHGSEPSRRPIRLWDESGRARMTEHQAERVPGGVREDTEAILALSG